MTTGERWARQPQSVWLRKALFQIHLWTGIGLGLYVLISSVSGSAIVFRNELYKSLGRPVLVTGSGTRLTNDEMKEAVRRAYPGYSVSFIWPGKLPNQTTEVWMIRNGKQKQRLFDPYTGKDVGEAIPYSLRTVAWLADLHTNLLFGKTGRLVNGLGALFLTLISLTGAVIWWPGVRNWRRSLTVQPTSNWKRLNWDLHSAIGFWSLSFVFMWGFTGIYVVFPTPFQRAIDHVAPLDRYRLVERDEPSLQKDSAVRFVLVAGEAPPPRPRRAPVHYSFGDQIVRWFTYLHFGNFAGSKTKALWVFLGMTPVFLFITGVIMWWNRVLSPMLRRSAREEVLTNS
jgi:uncharacterized iron-regulated membrane protein